MSVLFCIASFIWRVAISSISVLKCSGNTEEDSSAPRSFKNFITSFIPHTLSDDGDPVDVLVIAQTPILPGAVVEARPIGVLMMEDESGIDEKLIAVPKDKIHPFTKDIQDIKDLPQITLDRIAHFFERYKDLESGIIRYDDND